MLIFCSVLFIAVLKSKKTICSLQILRFFSSLYHHSFTPEIDPLSSSSTPLHGVFLFSKIDDYPFLIVICTTYFCFFKKKVSTIHAGFRPWWNTLCSSNPVSILCSFLRTELLTASFPELRLTWEIFRASFDFQHEAPRSVHCSLNPCFESTADYRPWFLSCDWKS